MGMLCLVSAAAFPISNYPAQVNHAFGLSQTLYHKTAEVYFPQNSLQNHFCPFYQKYNIPLSSGLLLPDRLSIGRRARYPAQNYQYRRFGSNHQTAYTENQSGLSQCHSCMAYPH